tara:strand:- start:177 stop:371 length:195 start_codon:yes stop_codon:yes gene_type:complete
MTELEKMLLESLSALSKEQEQQRTEQQRLRESLQTVLRDHQELLRRVEALSVQAERLSRLLTKQ